MCPYAVIIQKKYQFQERLGRHPSLWSCVHITYDFATVSVRNCIPES